MSQDHYEVYDKAGLILEGYFWDIKEIKEILKTYEWLKGNEVHIIDTTENEIAAIFTI